MENHISAHRFCTGNQEMLRIPQKCGCFYCLAIFPSEEVTDFLAWEGTAQCPRCGIDSVIGEAAGVEITPAFLRKMRNYWFGR